MPVPKKKHTHSRSKKRSNSPSKRRKILNLSTCSNCKKLRYSHKACPHCGFYK